METNEDSGRDTTDEPAVDDPPSLTQCVRETVAKMKKCVTDDPQSAVWVSLGAGLGVGLLLGAVMTRPPRRGRRRRVDRRSAEQLGRSVIDAAADSVPAAVAQHFNN